MNANNFHIHDYYKNKNKFKINKKKKNNNQQILK